MAAMKETVIREPDVGEVLVEAERRRGWFFIQIGRTKGTKRFNLSFAEAALLWPQLRHELESNGRPHD
jgi:hypothetical protein